MGNIWKDGDWKKNLKTQSPTHFSWILTIPKVDMQASPWDLVCRLCPISLAIFSMFKPQKQILQKFSGSAFSKWSSFVFDLQYGTHIKPFLFPQQLYEWDTSVSISHFKFVKDYSRYKTSAPGMSLSVLEKG